jgi:magnesium transporter
MKPTIVRTYADLISHVQKHKIVLHPIDQLDMQRGVYVSKMEDRPKYHFVCLEQLDFDKLHKNFRVKEVYTILTKTHVLIYDPDESRLVTQFFDEVDQKPLKDLEPLDYFVAMLDFYSEQMYRVIPKFSTEVEGLQTSVLNEKDQTDLISQLHRIKHNLIVYSGAVSPILDMVLSLLKDRHFKSTKKNVETIEHIRSRIVKVQLTLDNLKDQMRVLTDSNEAQIARRTSKNIGILTILNSVLLLPTIVTSIWQMFRAYNAGTIDLIWITAGFVVLVLITLVILKKSRII